MGKFGCKQRSVVLLEDDTIAYRRKIDGSGIVLTQNTLTEGSVMSIFALEKHPFHPELDDLNMEIGITETNEIGGRCKSLSKLAPKTHLLSGDLYRNFMETFDAPQSIGLMIQDGALFTFFNGINVEVNRLFEHANQTFRVAVNIRGRIRKIKLHMTEISNGTHLRYVCVKTTPFRTSPQSQVLKIGLSVQVCCQYGMQQNPDLDKVKAIWVTVDKSIHGFHCEGQVDAGCLERIPETVKPDYNAIIKKYTVNYKDVTATYSVIPVMCFGPPGTCDYTQWVEIDHDMQVKQLSMLMKNEVKKSIDKNDTKHNHEEKLIMPYLAYQELVEKPAADYSIENNMSAKHNEEKLIMPYLAYQELVEKPAVDYSIENNTSAKHIYYTDYGGQPQVLELLPALIKDGIVLMVVLKLNENLDRVPDNYTTLTNLEIIETITSTVSVYKTKQSGENEPHLLIIGTNADKKDPLKSSKIMKLNENLSSTNCSFIKHTERKCDIVFPMIKAGDRANLASLIRDRITQSKISCDVSIQWHCFTIHVAFYCEKVGRKVLSIQECIDIGLNSEVCLTKDQVEEALLHYDRANLYMYFPKVLPDFVIIDPQVLVTWVSELVEYIRNTTQRRIRSRSEGVVTKDALLNMCACMKSVETLKINLGAEQLISLFVHLNMLIKIRGDEYFIPNALGNSVLNCPRPQFTSHFDPLLLLPKTRLVPQGFFASLISHLLNREETNSFAWPNPNPTQKQYSNAVVMRYTGAQGLSDGGLVLIINNKSWLEVCYDGMSPKDANFIQETVFNMIPSVCDALNYDHEKVGFSHGFFCVLHSRKPQHACKVNSFAYPVSFECQLSGETSINHGTQKRMTSWLFNPDQSSNSEAHIHCKEQRKSQTLQKEFEELKIKLVQEQEKSQTTQKEFEELKIKLTQERGRNQTFQKEFEKLKVQLEHFEKIQIELKEEQEMHQKTRQEFSEFKKLAEQECENEEFENLQSLPNLEEKEVLANTVTFHELKKNMHELQAMFNKEREEHHSTIKEKKVLQAQCAQIKNSWTISYTSIQETEEELGRGGWGVIRVGIFREQRVAVKELYKSILSDSTLAVIHREISTMSRLRHPNLLLFICAVLDHPSGNPLIITEIMDTSLRQAYKEGQLTDKSTKLSVLRDTAAGLNYLHCHPEEIIHRDVSSANVLLESRGPNKWRAKLSDFGSANIACNATTQAPGAAVYAAPETLSTLADSETKPQTTKIDVYSFGILLCEVMSCSFPYPSKKFHETLQSVSSSSPLLGHLIQSCIKTNPSDRPTMKQIISLIDKCMYTD